MCPPERPRSGVSIPKYICASRIMHEDLTTDAPLQGDTGGHTGTAPTTLIEPPANAETILVIKQMGAHAQTLSVQM